MNNLFGNAAADLAGAEKDKDVLGGRQLFTTDVYAATVEVAYVTSSKAGAKAVNFVLDVGGRKHRETIYVTNKAGEVVYIGKDKKKYPLPGFSLVNALCKLSVGKELPQLASEPKLVKIYNFDLKKDVATEVPVLVELTGVTVSVAIELVRENKNVKDQTGEYVPGPETRDFNTIARVFHPTTGQTANEYDSQANAEFKDLYLKEFKGKLRDRSKPVAGAPAAAAAAAPGAAAGKPTLFGGG